MGAATDAGAPVGPGAWDAAAAPWHLVARYEPAGGGWAHEASAAPGRPAGEFERDLGLSVEVADRDGAREWHVFVRPSCDARLMEARACLGLPLAAADALYLNGYNSWTDSVERAPGASTPGFGVPRVAIRHWVLDGSGDYRFTPQDGRGGHQHGFEYGYLRRGDDVLLFGSLDVDSGFTTLFEDLDAQTMALAKEPPQGVLKAGERREVMSFMLVAGCLSECVGRWLRAAGVSARPARPLVGYTSWYRHYGDISAEKLLGDLDGVARELGPLDAPGCDKAFQIDDGYAKVGDWLEPDPERFPDGLAPLAREIHARGLLAGLWVAPFVCERKSRTFAEHPEWLLRDGAGEPVVTGSHWSGQVALDVEKPEVRDHIASVLHAMTYDWGFDLLKCDFLYAACMLCHAGKNRGELMASALDLIRSSVAPGCRLDFCGVPLGSAFGRCEYCRIGCDVGLDWDGAWYMRGTGRERVSTRASLANTHGRAHLDGRAFRCDPDVFFLRDDVRLSEAQRQDLLSSDASQGGVLFTSDDMGRWGQGQRAAFRRALSAFSSRAMRGR